MRARLIGASMSQKPSAAEATTGPKMRDTISVSASTPQSAAQGSNVREDWQLADVQADTAPWARMTIETSIAPIITVASTATYPSWIMSHR